MLFFFSFRIFFHFFFTHTFSLLVCVVIGVYLCIFIICMQIKGCIYGLYSSGFRWVNSLRFGVSRCCCWLCIWMWVLSNLEQLGTIGLWGYVVYPKWIVLIDKKTYTVGEVLLIQATWHGCLWVSIHSNLV